MKKDNKPIQGEKGCFGSSCKVLTPKGEEYIDTLLIGDEVYCYDDAGKLHVGTVKEVHAHEGQSLYHFSYWNGELSATRNHWVQNQFGAFVEIGTLTAEDALMDRSGYLRPFINSTLTGRDTVYSVSVEPYHTLIVNGIRAHNGGLGLEPYQEKISGNKGGGKGRGGGDSAPRVAVESPNTLRSRSTAKLVDLISEGEIEGLVNGNKSIFFNDTPLESANGENNFTGVKLELRAGTPEQEYISGFDTIEREVAVGIELRKTTELVRTISDPDINAVRIKIRIPQLTDQNTSNGDLRGSSVSFDVLIKPNGGGFSSAFGSATTISGKTTSPYERSYRIPLPEGGAPWDVKLLRVTADNDKANIQNKTFWSSYTELIEAKPTYPDSALIGISIDAQQFGSSIPTRAYEIKGLIINVPSNYDPVLRTYNETPIWDGTFKLAWSDNPAWVLYDLLTNKRYGLGDVLSKEQNETLIDKWSLYNIGKYCDVMVDDGFGGLEPRMTFNTVIHSQQEAYDVVNAIASAFRGMLYWGAGIVVATQDAPADPVKLVGPANVIEGQFNYEGAALKARHSVALVTWNDPADAYRPAIAVVEDPDMIARYGWKQADVVAYGATSKGQAVRFGRWLLDSEQHETETVTYRAALDHADVRPGDIISIADPAYAGVRFGGRIASLGNTPEHGLTLPSSFTPSPSIDHASFSKAASAVFACELTFPATPSGVIMEVGDSTTGFYVGANGTHLVFRAGDGATPPTDTMAHFTVPVTEVANQTGTLVVEINMTTHTIRAWLDNVQLGVATATPEFESNLWAGSYDGGYGSAGTSIVAGETNSAFNGTLNSDLRYYANQTVSLFPTVLTLDDTIEVGESYTLSVVLSDGTVEDKTVTTAAGTTNTLTLESALSGTPLVGAMWVLTASNVKPRQFRVIAVTEQEKNIFEITALLHDTSKYARVEENLFLEEPDYSALPSGDILPPSGISSHEYLYEAGIDKRSAVTLSWTPADDARVSLYEIEMIPPEESEYIPVGTTGNASHDIKGTIDGTYQFRIRSLSAFGQKSTWIEYTKALITIAYPPNDVTGFKIEIKPDGAELTWDEVKNLDLSHYTIKHSNKITGVNWNSASIPINGKKVIGTSITISAKGGTYLIKAVDSSEVESVNATTIISERSTLPDNLIAEVEEAPGFFGVTDGIEVLNGELKLSPVDTLDKWLAIADVSNLYFGINGLKNEGTYSFGNSLDLGAVCEEIDIKTNISIQGTNLSNVMSSWTELAEQSDLDGTELSVWDKEFQIRTTNDDPTVAPSWSNWAIFESGLYEARAFEWQLKLYSDNPVVTPLVDQLSVIVDVDDRLTSGNDLVCPAQGMTVTFDREFMATPAVGIDMQDMQSGDYKVINNKSASGFDIQFFNSSDVGVSRTFDYLAKGYGKKL